MKKGQQARNFSLSGFIKLIRVQNLAIIVLSQYLLALFLLNDIELFNLRLFLLSFCTVLLAAAGYIINDYYDVKIDYLNKPDRVIVGKVLKRRVVLFWHTFLNFLSIGLGFYLSWKIGLIFFFTAFMLWFYSNQLKRLPFIGNFTVALLTGLSLSVVSIYFQQKEILVNIYAVFAFGISLIREIIKDMEDWQGDAKFGCKTLPIVLGLRKTKLIVFVLVFSFGFLIFYLTQFLDNIILYYYFSAISLFIIYFLHRLSIADKVKDFHFLSNYCKLIMLSGILSMLFF